MQRVFKDKPPRLELIFQRANAPVYFISFNTHRRARPLASHEVHQAFIEYCRRAAEFRIGVGRYVLMPDHIQLFVRFGMGCTSTLGAWVKGLKRHLDGVLLSMGHQPLQLAQPGFSDHVLRSDESCIQKWEYVSQNPVRAGLVDRTEDWSYAGEIVRIDRT